MIRNRLEDKIEETVTSALETEALNTNERINPPANEKQKREQLNDPVEVGQPADDSVFEADDTQETPEPVRVAGLGTVIRNIGRQTKRRVTEAERRATMQTAEPPPVQEVGDTIVITPADPDEVQRINEQLGGEYTSGLNMPEILRTTGDFDAAEYMSRFKDANAELFEEARRGTIGFDQMLEMAEARGFDDIAYDLMARQPGETLPPEDFLAGMLAHTQMMKQARGQWQRAYEMPEGPDREAAMRQALALSTAHAKIASNISATSSEAARTLQLAGEVGRRGMPEVSQELTLFGAKTAQEIEYVGRHYLAITDPRAQRRFAEKGMAAKSMDVMAEVFINSILSSPITHMINIAGNSMYQGMHSLETFVAAGFGRARTAVTGSSDRVRAREGLARLEGIRNALTDSMLVAGKTFATETPVTTGSKIDARTRRAIGTTGNPKEILEMGRKGELGPLAVNAFGAMTRVPGRFLMSEDEFFKGIASRASLYEQAQMRAHEIYEKTLETGGSVEDAQEAAALERANIINDPPEEIKMRAEESARELTFQSELKGWLGQAQGAMSHPIAKLFVPFFRTPANIMKSTLQRSPVMAVYPGFYKKLRAGGREADLAMSKVAMGSTIMSAFAYASFGLDDEERSVRIIGRGPSDPQARAALRRQGFQPYSVNIKQDDGTYKSFTFSRFDPISGMLAMAADFAYYAQYENDQNTLDELAMAMSVGVAQYLMEMPLLQGASDVQSALMRPNPAEKFDAMFELLGEKTTTAALGAMPGVGAASRAASRVEDPTLRETYMLPEEGMFGEDPTKLPSAFRGFYTALEKAKAGNPMFNDELPPRLNEWGEEIRVGKGVWWEFFSPVRVRDTQYSRVDEEMVNLGGGIPRTPRKIDGVLLNREQRNRWIELANNIDQFGRLPSDPEHDPSSTMIVDLDRLIQTDEYAELPTNDDKLRVIKNLVSERRSAAKKYLLEQDAELRAQVNSMQ
jgi:hypothetical protein